MQSMTLGEKILVIIGAAILGLGAAAGLGRLIRKLNMETIDPTYIISHNQEPANKNYILKQNNSEYKKEIVPN